MDHTTTAGRAPGSLHHGLTMCIPSRYEGMTPHQMTMSMLQESGNTEFFKVSSRGRRKGETPTLEVTMYNAQTGSAFRGEIETSGRTGLDMEPIKAELRRAANKK
jgi:hypothetical protein